MTQVLAGRYELGHTLGRGGMAEVHAGHDHRLGREVAVKVLRADLARDPMFLTRFQREAQHVAGLNHPGIVAVYDTGEVLGGQVGLPFIVMEYVSGSTLRDLVRTHGPMAPERAAAVMAEVCAALDFSHQAGIVHRDIKPANVMITPDDVVKVMDFGIARAMSQTQTGLTGAENVIGTAQYLSPEQGLGKDVDARSDVYAAGCVLFELLTGEPPFTGDSPISIVYQHVREDPPLPSDRVPGVPTALDAVALRALAKNPDNRYPSAEAMRADLERVLAGERPEAPAVLAAGDDTTASLAAVRPERTGAHAAVVERRPGRRRLVAVLAGVLVVAAVLGVGMWLTGAGASAEVPAIVGMTQPDALRAVTGAGLRPDVAAAPSTPEQNGKVVAVEPAAGQEVEQDATVTLRVGRGPGLVQVPLLVGRSPEAARVAAEEAGFVLTPLPRMRDTDDAAEVGAVVGQEPVPGTLLMPGTSLQLVIGQRRETLQVPDVVGRDRSTAVSSLEGVGLEVRTTTTTSSQPAGTVVAVSPGAGTSVASGSTVTLQISDGSAAAAPTTTAPAPTTTNDAADGDGSGEGGGGGGGATPGTGDGSGGSGDGEDSGDLFPDGVFGDR